LTFDWRVASGEWQVAVVAAWRWLLRLLLTPKSDGAIHNHVIKPQELCWPWWDA